MVAGIQGVGGVIPADALGFTLMHEHILTLSWSMRQAFPDWLDRDSLIDYAASDLSLARASGVDTIVDATPLNLGRDVDILVEAAARSGMQIIAATGLYWTEEPWLDPWEPDRLVEWLLRDLSEGIQGTGVKAGLIKCGTDRLGLTPLNSKLLQVAARLHRASGAPISTHSEVSHRLGLLQQEVFAEEGVDLARVIIGHCGDSEDLDYLEALLARGSTLGMDRFGPHSPLPTAARVQVIVELCRRGYANRMVLSHDASLASDWWPARPTRWDAPSQASPYSYIPEQVVPVLREAGVTDVDIDQMTCGNPQRLLGPCEPY
ncbi:MAG: phosphotriesterase family protein [Anaerolineae bacterium]